MLTIQHAQFTVLFQLEVEKFEGWTLAHLRKFFPRQCVALGERQMRESMRRAARYGFMAKRDVCEYIDLMIALGLDFDTDKRNRWAAEIPGRRGHPGAKMQALFKAANLRLEGRQVSP
jgi:hypothetical protein